MSTNCLIRCGLVLLVADDQRSSFMTTSLLPPVGVRLSFVRGMSVFHPWLATLTVSRYSGTTVYPLSGLPYTGDLSVRLPWFALSTVSEYFGSLDSHT